MRNVAVKSYTLPPMDEREILRYAGVNGEADGEIFRLLSACKEECQPYLSPKACYTLLPKEEFFSRIAGARESQGLREILVGDEVLLFAATVGIGVDRLLARYATISPAKALFFQAIGAERVEALCREVCREAESLLYGKRLGRRFSAGYGDFPLSAQRDIFRLLDCPKRIGLSLTDSLLMTPTKSVTAVASVTEGAKRTDEKCAACDKKNCEYRV